MRPYIVPLLLLAATALPAQTVASSIHIPRDTATGIIARASKASATAAVAIRAATPPDIDGKDTDPVWREAQVIDAFEVFQPTEGGTPRFRTEVRVAFDDRYFYAFTRMHDARPDSILALLSRRDVRTQSDQIKLMIDSYHDRRTGYEFAVNPAGVKRDYYIYNDVMEDQGWDAVWDARTTIDSLGWTAEFRIPLSQMRFANKGTHTFGFAVWRDVARHNERYSWPLYRNSKYGISSQLGELSGIAGIGAIRRLEVTPYTVSKDETQKSPRPGDRTEYGRLSTLSGGADIKYGLSSNLTLDATVNPDFGQVEADPSILNLGAFEAFFEERRPFFLEGSGIFNFSLGGGDGASEGLFYSRRIGRAPQLGGVYGNASTPTTSTILGAGKLTGRTSSGLSVGLLNAVTEREIGAENALGRYQTVEPRTHYTVGRLQQDFRKGMTGIGVMVSGVNRDLDEFTERHLRRSAYAAGLDYRHRFLGNRFEVNGYTAASRVEGSAEAIMQTQLSPVHYFQRPDDGEELDPDRTRLDGWSQSLGLSKVGGFLRFNSSYQYISRGFEINDAGFLMQADRQSWNNWVGIRGNQPRAFWRRASLNINNWNQYTTNGLLTDRGGNINGFLELKNSWSVHGGVTAGQLAGSFCSSACTRGGPALRESPRYVAFGGINGDPRPKLVPEVFGMYIVDDYGRSRYASVNPSAEMRVASNLSMSLGPSFTWNTDDSQFYGDYEVGGQSHYTFAHLDQRTFGMSTRVNYTMTRDLSLQVYAQPFVTKGKYANIRELDDPRAKDYDARFKPYFDQSVTANPAQFNYKEFRSNTVLRWEYRPGSSIYLVWAQGRSFYDPLEAGPLEAGHMFRRDVRNLFRLHPDNTFLIKASYWFSL